MRALRSIIPLAVVLAGGSCTLTDPNADPLIVSVSVDMAQLNVGQVINISVIAANNGSKDVTLTAPASCLFFFQVRDVVSGTLEYASNDRCTGNQTTLVLKPGDQQVGMLQWDGRGSLGSRVNSGNYILAGGATEAGHGVLGETILISVE